MEFRHHHFSIPGGIDPSCSKKQVKFLHKIIILSSRDMRWRERFDIIRIGLKASRRKDESPSELIGRRIDLKRRNQSKCPF
ncbi:hypothetical protein Tco_1577343 [Tanacetum coccineum]